MCGLFAFETTEIIKLSQHAFISNLHFFTPFSSPGIDNWNSIFISSSCVLLFGFIEISKKTKKPHKKGEKNERKSIIFRLRLSWRFVSTADTRQHHYHLSKGHRTVKQQKEASFSSCAIDTMSPSKLSFHDGHILNHQPPILNLSPYTASLASSSSPASGISHDSDGRSSSSSPNNLNSNIFGGYGHACSHCTSSFLTRDLLEKHELMHISNATMVSVFLSLSLSSSSFRFVWCWILLPPHRRFSLAKFMNKRARPRCFV